MNTSKLSLNCISKTELSTNILNHIYKHHKNFIYGVYIDIDKQIDIINNMKHILDFYIDDQGIMRRELYREIPIDDYVEYRKDLEKGTGIYIGKQPRTLQTFIEYVLYLKNIQIGMVMGTYNKTIYSLMDTLQRENIT